MGKASKLYNSLTHQQKQFYQEKTLSTTMKIKAWISFLSRVSSLDKLEDDMTAILMRWAIASFVVAFVSIIAAAVSEIGWILFGTLLLVIVGIVLLIRRKKLKQKDVNNYLRLFFLPILNVLKDKAGDDAKLSASLDFRNPRKVLEPVKSTIGVRKQKLYSPTYIISKVPLTDDTLLEFAVKDDIKDLRWTKRSASGKTKYKSKTKFVHQCFIKMTLPKKEYTWNGTEAPGVQIIDHNDQYVAKVKVKIKKVGDHVLHVKAFFDAIQSVYGQFQPLNPTTNAPTSKDESVEYEDVFMAVPYVWYGGYFDRYDYDSFDHSDTGEVMMDDDATNVFDS